MTLKFETADERIAIKMALLQRIESLATFVDSSMPIHTEEIRTLVGWLEELGETREDLREFHDIDVAPFFEVEGSPN